MSSTSDSNRTIHLSNLPFEGQIADPEKYKQVIAEAFKNYGFEKAQILDRTKDGKVVLVALVTLKTEEDAQRALKDKVVEIQGKQVIIQKYISEKDYQLYIKDIGTLTQKQLEEFFGASKKLNNVHTYSKNSLTSAIVSFENPKDAKEYIDKLELTINGVAIKVLEFIPKESRDDHKQLWLTRIPIVDRKIPDLQQELTKEFSKFGHVSKPIDIEVKEGAKTGSTVISFENTKSLEQARSGFNVNLFGANSMRIEYFLSRKEREQRDQKDSTIFVKNILGDVDIEKFTELFSQFGKVESKSFNKFLTPNDVTLQRGTITFATNQEMNEVLAGWPKIPKIHSYFLDKKPLINIFQDKSQRNDFLKTVKPNKPHQAPQSYNNAMRPPPYMMHGIPPLGMGQIGLPPLGMPGMPMMPGVPPMQYMNPGMMGPNPLAGNLGAKVQK